MKIRAFKAFRPASETAAEVASPPYDVLSDAEARAMTGDNDSFFLHVTMPQIDLPEGTSAKDDVAYAKAGENLDHFLSKGYLKAENAPCFYLYRQIMGDHVQRGVVTLSLVEDYEKGLIKKHEFTRRAPEDDRTRHISSLNAQCGPVFLTYRDEAAIDAFLAEVEAGEPETSFVAADGIAHAVWPIADTAKLEELFGSVEAAYIADGHHRAAAAARVCRERKAETDTGDEPYYGFLTVLFPASQLKVLAYNRVVNSLNGMDTEGFLKRLGEDFAVSETAEPLPATASTASMYLGGKWYGLSWKVTASDNPVDSLDVSMLQNNLFSVILGIEDPRADERIAFVGGIRGTKDLERRVDSGEAVVAFSLYPTAIEQLMDVSDANLVMPPKSTWFEPKLRSGLFVHRLV